ncbi:MAG TPA: hypothetical protein VK195_02235 [Burkholderiaceae bacterium]|nr:hypothetical protein [Burkholderiaceae bacterium]
MTLTPPSPPSPDAAQLACRCERCGRLLPSQDAVCAPCEAELAAPAPDHRRGKYRCPACSQAFVRPDVTLRPAHARWYMPQYPAPCCPHCRVRLLDRRHPRMPAREALTLVAPALASQILLPSRQFRLVLFVLLLVFLGLQIYRHPWGLPDELRYERDEA